MPFIYLHHITYKRRGLSMLSLQTIHPDTLAILIMTYFADANPQPMPYMFEDVDWETVKNKIKKEVEDYSRNHS